MKKILISLLVGCTLLSVGCGSKTSMDEKNGTNVSNKVDTQSTSTNSQKIEKEDIKEEIEEAESDKPQEDSSEDNVVQDAKYQRHPNADMVTVSSNYSIKSISLPSGEVINTATFNINYSGDGLYMVGGYLVLKDENGNIVSDSFVGSPTYEGSANLEFRIDDSVSDLGNYEIIITMIDKL